MIVGPGGGFGKCIGVREISIRHVLRTNCALNMTRCENPRLELVGGGGGGGMWSMCTQDLSHSKQLRGPVNELLARILFSGVHYWSSRGPPHPLHALWPLILGEVSCTIS